MIPYDAHLDLPAIAWAVCAALLFALSNNVQRATASQVPLEAGGPVRLFLRLLRTPRWLAGSSLAVVALVLHVVALGAGGVILVQAILATGLVAALAMEAVRERRWIRGSELVGSVVLVAGVVLLLGWGRPGDGRAVDVSIQVSALLVLLVVAAIGLSASRAHHLPTASAVVMGACAGACFAIDAVFLKGLASHSGPWLSLPLVVNAVSFTVASVFGNVIIQRAYQRAPLRVGLPAVTAADPIAAFAIGRLLLHEQVQPGLGPTLAVGVGLLAIVLGIVVVTVWGGAAERAAAERAAAQRALETAG